MKEVHDIPYVPKENVSLLVVSHSLESHALRSVLELYNYRIETHWIGSRKELIKILRGEIPTHNIVILDCHGDEDHGIIVPWESPIGANELANIVSLQDRLFVSLGCFTGKEEIAKVFIEGGCIDYIAPIDGIHGNSTLFFSIHLFYYLSMGLSLKDAVSKSRAFDKHCGFYRHYSRV